MEVRDASPRPPQQNHDDGSVPLNDRYFDEMRRKKAAAHDHTGSSVPVQPQLLLPSDLPASIQMGAGEVTIQAGVAAERPQWSMPSIAIAPTPTPDVALAGASMASLATVSAALPSAELPLVADASTLMAHRQDAVDPSAVPTGSAQASSTVSEAAEARRTDVQPQDGGGRTAVPADEAVIRASAQSAEGGAHAAGNEQGDEVKKVQRVAGLSPDDRLPPSPGGEQVSRSVQHGNSAPGEAPEGEARREGGDVSDRKVREANASQRVAANSETVRQQSALVYRLNTWGPQHSVNITMAGRDVTLRSTSPSVVAALASADAPSDLDARYLVEASVDREDGDDRRGQRRSGR